LGSVASPPTISSRKSKKKKTARFTRPNVPLRRHHNISFGNDQKRSNTKIQNLAFYFEGLAAREKFKRFKFFFFFFLLLK
jgi:hypothetical protein